MRGFTSSLLPGGLIFGIGGYLCLASPAEAREPIPAAAALAAAEARVRQTHEDDFRTGGTDPKPLIQKLLAAAEQSEDPAFDYALFLEAEKAAVAAGAVGLAMDAVDARAEQFDIDRLQARVERVADCLTPKARTDVGLLKALWEYAIENAENGLADESLPPAKKAAETAGQVAKALLAAGRARKDESLVADSMEKQTYAQGLVKSIGRRSAALAEYRKAVEALTTDADDPKANGVVGRYLCFEKNDWAAGLPALAKGDQEDLAAAAAGEIELSSSGEERPAAEKVLAVADAWWQASEAGAVRRHAASLYERVLPDIGDPDKRATATKRIANANPDAERPRRPAKGPVVAKKPGGGRRPAALDVPASAVVPVPAELSEKLVPLLPAEDEVMKLKNHLNVADEDLTGLRVEMWRRIHSGFGVDKWTLVDLMYLVELNDTIGTTLGRFEWRSAAGRNVGGMRDAKARSECSTAMGMAWVLTSKNEQEFIRRARALPAGVLDPQCVGQYLTESDVKGWLVWLGEEYASIPRKAHAIDVLIEAGFATPGVVHYREELGRAMASGNR